MKFIVGYTVVDTEYIVCSTQEDAEREIEDLTKSFIENVGYVPNIELFAQMDFDYKIEVEV